MGPITKKIREGLQSISGEKIVSLEAARRGEEIIGELPTIDQLVAVGQHLIHAIYKTMANLLSVFYENMPFLYGVDKFFYEAEDRYLPDENGFTPILTTIYNHWAFFDVRFKPSEETLGDCFLGVSDLIGLDVFEVEAVENLCHSRLGLYEILGSNGDIFQVRELVTDQKLSTIIPTKFLAEPGTLAFLRILPPLKVMDCPNICVTTPYVTRELRENDWLEYFKRHQILPGAPGAEDRLYRHMKYGKNRYYWCEFFFHGYLTHRFDAVFVKGFPDRPKTQPRHILFNRGRRD
ncbi:MAG: hypothetical protein O3C21_17260 [Verrucomicrobia bacterium]|nr:hypothetical protein [Verrucomicrobiota bacterium]